MLSFTQGRDVIRRELDATLARLEDLDEAAFSKPTRCEGWTIHHLVAHVADAADFQGEAFARIGSGDVPEVPELKLTTPADAVDRVRLNRDKIVSALEAIGPDREGEHVPLPFATLPASVAVVVAVIEYGFHHNDLTWALGDEVPVPDDVASTLIETLPAFLPMIETKPADAPLAYTLAAPAGSVSVLTADGSWTVGDPGDAPTCTISGDDSAVALFAMGRIPATHPSLTVDGDAAVAARFKHHFPGP